MGSGPAFGWSHMKTVVWFRRDLRVRDNSALYEATSEKGRAVVALYIITPEQWQEHDDAPAKVHFWLENVRELKTELEALHIPLLVRETKRYDQIPRLITKLMAEVEADALYVNAEYEVNERGRDEAVRAALKKKGGKFLAFTDRVILAPDAIETGGGTPYTVFTPYRKKWTEHASESAPSVLPRARKQEKMRGISSDDVPEKVRGFDFTSARPDLWPAGESAAKKKLSRFVKEKIEGYDDRRDFPAVAGTSTLSPCLAAGVLSPRQCFEAARDANNGSIAGGRKGIATWISEIIWREFYTHILYSYPRVSMHRPFRLDTERLIWNESDELYDAWREGRTGYPIVDAAQRQLVQTGWMHNRLRMVTAMFFSKDLFLDWRLGERHFMQNLVDGDLAANNGGWQWSASTGTDAAPYFRIFNPDSQSARFDPDAKFIKKFCPELADVDPKKLHNVAKFTPLERAACDYPEPIVDHKRARERAIDAFKNLK